MTLPSLMTIILLHFYTVLSLCAITIDVIFFKIFSRDNYIFFYDSSSNALVASSSKRTLGFLIRALAIAILYF